MNESVTYVWEREVWRVNDGASPSHSSVDWEDSRFFQ